MSKQAYNVALKVTQADGSLAKNVGLLVTGRMDVDVVAGVSYISGSIMAILRGGMPADAVSPIPFVSFPKLPAKIKRTEAGTLLQGPSGIAKIQTRLGTPVSVTWFTRQNGDIAITFAVIGNTLFGFTEFGAYGKARPVASVAPPVIAPPTTFKIHSPRTNYVAWTGVDRKGWPEDDGMNGLLYGAPVGEPERKIEHVPKNRENTGFWNAINPKDHKYFQPSFTVGKRIRFSIRDIKGKLVNPAYAWEVIYK